MQLIEIEKPTYWGRFEPFIDESEEIKQALKATGHKDPQKFLELYLMTAMQALIEAMC